ncbi:MAG TPA: RHS repeat-associated core domain-containing protein, partial [Gammaproteobacteria bacterium]|nr:RHS repeat-associated core domain-containing protein [Gammaproteobacteria bacterium]
MHIHAVTHLNNALKFNYDANGNMTTRISNGKTWTQTWTVENMLKQATSNQSDSVGMKYDADGQLVLRVENGGVKRSVILGDGLYEKEYLGGGKGGGEGVPVKRYMFNGQAIAQRSAAGVYFQLNDHLGGVIATFTSSGGVSMVRRDAWGKELYRLGNLASSNYLFTGQRWDKLLGLYDYNARYYDAELGRFLSADTIIPEKDMLVSTLSQ